MQRAGRSFPEGFGHHLTQGGGPGVYLASCLSCTHQALEGGGLLCAGIGGQHSALQQIRHPQLQGLEDSSIVSNGVPVGLGDAHLQHSVHSVRDGRRLVQGGRSSAAPASKQQQRISQQGRGCRPPAAGLPW